tara:strand:- start:325 stop:501 length:177 start_codon:yes stop_codon:yes gene_type:complete
MPTFTLEVIEKHYKTYNVEANNIQEAKEKVLGRPTWQTYEDDKDRVVVEVYDTEWNEL